ncbi:methionine--tRNA ligase subunit beta, partial [Myxococcota bacterium]|nr:methionine--tRNA ligase subunit beta [Myxococcota bacterium]
GLRDWDISRDGPYFGFTIPGHPDKFFYVWMDAPLGYIASSLEWARENNVDIDELWKSDKTRIEHFIGKDIVYFHTLFWPAVLKSAGYSLPSKVHVHGMLTVNGKKMSKSRGTFINAADFAEHLEPEALRFYYASKFNSGTDDLDLSFDDFILRTNSELVNKHANLFSRVSNFIASRLDNRLGDLPFTAEEIQGEPDESGTPLDLARKVRAAAERIEENYQNREFGQVVRDLGVIADIGNEFMQSQKPWVQVKEDVETARETLTFAANICHAIAMYIAPITPAFSENGAKVFASSIPKMDSKALFLERNREMGEVSRLFERIDPKSVEALLAETQEQLKPTEEPETPAIELKPEITWDDFQTLDLRVGHIVSVEKVKKSKKLLRVMVNIGEAEPRQIVAGISPTYNEENLLPGHQVVVVANLAPAKLMGVESNGMILAAGEHPGLSLVSVGSSPDGSVLPPGTSVR